MSRDEAWRPPAPLLPLLILFFLSGASGLLYEVLWMRRLTLVFGATQLAISTVLGAFMLGLAGGSALAGLVADRVRRHLVVYGVLELLIGLWAVCFPWFLRLATGLYASAFGAESVDWWSAQLLRLLLMSALLVVPTAAMGATLPLLARFIAGRMSRVAQRTGLLYGVNTAGAVVGTWATGFVLLPWLGVRSTELLAAGANVAIGVVALVWAARVTHSVVLEDDREERAEEAALLDLPPDPDLAPGRRVWVGRLAVLALAASGACAMVYEVAWSRFLALILGSSVYAFSLMLVAFLVGTAGGSLYGSWLVGRPTTRPLPWLAGALAGAGITAFATNHLFRFFPYWYVDLYAVFDGHDSFVFVSQALLACVAMTPTTFCLGLAFPFATALAVDRPGRVGRQVSIIYLGNTLGAVLGALLAGFALIPWLGIQLTLLVAVQLDLLLAAVLVGVRAAARARRIAVVGLLLATSAGVGLARPPWDPLLMSSGMYQYVSDLSDLSHEAVRNFALSDFELLYYAEGVTSVVTVARSMGSGNIWLANNGKVDASTQSDLRTQVLLGHLPLLYRPQSKTALVVGLASGITAGSVTHDRQLERIDVLEIEPAVVEASHYFDEHNGQPLDDPRVHMITNDARNHLVLTDVEYDVIINEPSNPWISGVSNLFTREYLQLGRSRLAPDGIFVQWTQIYGMGEEDLRSLLATFIEVFPHALAFSAVEDTDVILVGGRLPLDVLPGEFLSRDWEGERAADLARIGVDEPFDLLALLLMDQNGIAAFSEGGVPNTDDNARIEFNAPKNLHYSTSEENIQLLLEAATGPYPLYERALRADPDRVRFLLGLADAYERRELWLLAAQSYLRALELRPRDPEISQRLLDMRERANEEPERKPAPDR